MFCHCETYESEVSILDFGGVTRNNSPAISDVRNLPAAIESKNRQHSPGPWDMRVNDQRKETIPYEITIVSTGTSFRNEVATFVPIGDGEHDGTTLAANIALAIAAPDMLRELENILFRFDMEPSDSDFPGRALREGIRKTIAKAKTITPRIFAECSRLAKEMENADDAACDFD